MNYIEKLKDWLIAFIIVCLEKLKENWLIAFIIVCFVVSVLKPDGGNILIKFFRKEKLDYNKQINKQIEDDRKGKNESIYLNLERIKTLRKSIIIDSIKRKDKIRGKINPSTEH